MEEDSLFALTVISILPMLGAKCPYFDTAPCPFFVSLGQRQIVSQGPFETNEEYEGG